MIRWFGVCMVGLLAVAGTALCTEDDPIRAKLDRAKAVYDADVGKYRAAVNDFLDKREDAARKDANKRLVDQVKAERQAFAEKGEVPKTLPSTIKTQLVAARLNLESAYKTAVKDYTRGKQDEKASAVEKELADFNKVNKVEAAEVVVPTDPFQVKSVWVSENPTRTLTVLERKGETFRARFVLLEKNEFEFTGTVKEGKVVWFLKDVRIIRGTAAGDNLGTIGSDKFGDKIDFVFRGIKGGTGSYTLRLSKGK